MEKILKSLEDTQSVANELSKKLTKPVIVAFSGELGAGKTTFIKYLCRALGFSGVVTSPTFTIMNQYDGIIPIYHYDMYRIHGAEELYNIGFYDFADNGISLIEWSENVRDGLDGDIIWVKLEYYQGFRKITITENEK